MQGKMMVPKVSRKLAQERLRCDNKSNTNFLRKQLDRKVIK